MTIITLIVVICGITAIIVGALVQNLLELDAKLFVVI